MTDQANGGVHTGARGGCYQNSRHNALRHGILSKCLLLPGEDENEYDALLSALVEEHRPQGPTEEHLVEELAGIMWRKRRHRLAEVAHQRQKLVDIAFLGDATMIVTMVDEAGSPARRETLEAIRSVDGDDGSPRWR